MFIPQFSSNLVFSGLACRIGFPSGSLPISCSFVLPLRNEGMVSPFASVTIGIPSILTLSKPHLPFAPFEMYLHSPATWPYHTDRSIKVTNQAQHVCAASDLVETACPPQANLKRSLSDMARIHRYGARVPQGTGRAISFSPMTRSGSRLHLTVCGLRRIGLLLEANDWFQTPSKTKRIKLPQSIMLCR